MSVIVKKHLKRERCYLAHNMDIYDEIINELSHDEIHIMEILGKLEVSPHKNIDIHTLKKRLHGKYEKNFDKSLQHLKNLGLVGVYRADNICMSNVGLIVARRLYDIKLKNTCRF